MTFSDAVKRQAGLVMSQSHVSETASWSDCRARLASLRPFAGRKEADQQELFEAGKGYLGKAVRPAVDPKLLASPYRFVPLNDQVGTVKMPNRATPRPNGFSGSITVEWAFETPFLIGQTLVEQERDRAAVSRIVQGSKLRPQLEKIAIPMAFEPGEFVVPGATFKGLIRSILEIVTCSRLGEVNEKSKGKTLGVQKVIRRAHPAHVSPSANDEEGAPDRTEALLGFLRSFKEDDKSDASSTLALKSRVSFGFATLVQRGSARLGSLNEAVMMAPQPGFAPFYLAAQEDGHALDWSDGYSSLAGRKRFFPRFPADRLNDAPGVISGAVRNSVPNNAPESSRCWFIFLEPTDPGEEMRFRSTIRFHNVGPSEIGSVLWALTLGGPCRPEKPFRHMIGRGKPFGAGQARVVNIDLSGLTPNSDAGRALLTAAEPWERSGGGLEGWVDPGQFSLGPFLRAFDDSMTALIRPGRKWSRDIDIAAFLSLAAPAAGAKWADEGRACYTQRRGFAEIADAVAITSGAGPVNPFTPGRLLSSGAIIAQRPYNAPDKI